jgi:hypothetical protein
MLLFTFAVNFSFYLSPGIHNKLRSVVSLGQPEQENPPEKTMRTYYMPVSFSFV